MKCDRVCEHVFTVCSAADVSEHECDIGRECRSCEDENVEWSERAGASDIGERAHSPDLHQTQMHRLPDQHEAYYSMD